MSGVRREDGSALAQVHGFKKFLIVNSHGGNGPPISVLMQKLMQKLTHRDDEEVEVCAAWGRKYSKSETELPNIFVNLKSGIKWLHVVVRSDQISERSLRRNENCTGCWPKLRDLAQQFD